jgi:polyisoprenoid-binding protein YceI
MLKYLCFLITLSLILVACNSRPVETETLDTPPVGPSILAPTDTLGANGTAYPPPGQNDFDNPTTSPTMSQTEAYPAPVGGNAVNPTSPPLTSGDGGYPAGGAFLQSFQIVPGESQVTYEVNITLLNENNRIEISIGSTNDVTGEILVDRENPQNSIVRFVNIETARLDSGDEVMDDAIRDQYLEAVDFPFVTFLPQEIHGLPSTYEEGQPLSFEISGDLTIRQVTNPVTFDVTAQLQDNSLSGEAVATILLSEFGIGPVGVEGLLTSADEVKLKIEFVARP